ncbi:hypothetical protein HPP92_014433 [Vanilla planifolia]|uniref:Sphingomyelin synthase-like domain-containing protein n=1 Tax=Vanilla planifolia TaxID=51239 RepID=A0A835QKG6_VANPL|nr:hypothetical protein HPP92_014433 [Vanilla planifolia]
MERAKEKEARSSWRLLKVNAGLGLAAISYVFIDYLRYVSTAWHERLQPALWAILALAAVFRVPFYSHWTLELTASISFLASLLFMLSAFLCEAISVRFVTAVLGFDWHRSAAPLPDIGQWLLLALNERLPKIIIDIFRAHIVGLHHFLMLFIMLGFSVLFNSIRAPGLGLAARYMFTMAIGRLLRTITFVSTILPSPTLILMPFGDLYKLIHITLMFLLFPLEAIVNEYPAEYQPDWGRMNFLANILRPSVGEGSTWSQLLKKASGGCNDLMYSGHMLVAALTAMAWTEAYGGWTSALIWLLVLHSAQREIRERHHYSVDVIVAIYVGILLWKMTGFIWSNKDAAKARRLAKLDEVHGRLVHAAKDSDIDEIRDLLIQVDIASHEPKGFPQWMIWAFAGVATAFSLACVLLAFTWTNDG